MPSWTPAPYSLPYITGQDVLEQTPSTNEAQMRKISQYLEQVAHVSTTFPSDPVVGDTVMYLADSTYGVYWQFYYDGLGSYPWKFVGGSPVEATVGGVEDTTSVDYAALATPGPEIVLPFPGDWDVTVGCDVAHTSATVAAGIMSYDFVTTRESGEEEEEHLQVVNDSVPQPVYGMAPRTVANDMWGAWALASGPGYAQSTMHNYRHRNLSSSTRLVSKYRSPMNLQMWFGMRTLEATPVRISVV